MHLMERLIQTDTICGMCGEPLTQDMKPTVLFGARVSQKCSNAFNGRRQLAFLIDAGACLAIAFPVASHMAAADLKGDGRVSFWMVWAICTGMLFFKDVCRGRSLGKCLCGLQVVDVDTGDPIGLRQALQRNLSLVLCAGGWRRCSWRAACSAARASARSGRARASSCSRTATHPRSCPRARTRFGERIWRLDANARADHFAGISIHQPRSDSRRPSSSFRTHGNLSLRSFVVSFTRQMTR